MSKFRGYTFSILPESDGTFPIVTFDGEFYWYECNAVIKDNATLESMQQLITVCTPKRPRGTIGTVAHIEAGRTIVSNLEVPYKAGALRTYKALMTEFGDVKVHAKGVANTEQYEVKLKFLLMSNPFS